MLRWLPITAVFATFFCEAMPSGPSEFYIVTDFFSDNGAVHYYRVIDVRQDGDDSVARYTRVAPTRAYCHPLIVQSTEARVAGRAPARLVSANNPCKVSSAALERAIKRYSRHTGVFETINSGIVANCGASSVVLALPDSESVNIGRLRSKDPAIADLWNFDSEITRLFFGEKDVFQDRSEIEDAQLQKAGEEMLSTLSSGQFDVGLAAAVKHGGWQSPSFRSLLMQYRGPASEKEIESGELPRLINAEAWHFARLALPKYPPLALAAQVRGIVELQVTVQPITGEVREATAISGPLLLRQASVDAARQWQFIPGTIRDEIFRVSLDFASQCP